MVTGLVLCLCPVMIVHAADDYLSTLEAEADDTGVVNGSVSSIAGITNEQGNVMGLMPHPERCSDEVLGNTDGLAMFRSLEKHL